MGQRVAGGMVAGSAAKAIRLARLLSFEGRSTLCDYAVVAERFNFFAGEA